MVKYSLEAMDARVSSKLGTELEALWQEVIDYRDKDLKGVSFQGKVNAIQTMFAKKIAKRFMDIVYKHTGLYITTVFFKPHFETCFCTWICAGKGALNQRGTQQIEGILNGQANNLVGDLNWNEFTPNELIKMASSYDTTKGIIKPEMRKQIKEWFKCAIGFDLSLGFLSNDYLPKGTDCEYLNARELTAIMLHEIGHNLTLIEHAADMYARQSLFKALENAFKLNATPEKTFVLARAIAKYAKEHGYESDAAKLLEATARAEADFKSTGGSKSPAQEKKFIGSFIASIFYLLFTVIGSTFTSVFGNPTSEFNRMGQKKKLGDTIINERMWTWQERKADEYAFSHGYGADQVKALEKIYAFYRYIGKSEEEIKRITAIEKANSDISLTSKIGCMFWSLVMFTNDSARMYPPGSQRYKEILGQTIRELKNHGASAEYISKYVSDADAIIASIDNMAKEDKYVEECIYRWKAFYKIFSIRSFVSWLIDGRIDTELANIIDSIHSLNDNLMTYYGHKFEQLAKRV